MIKHIVLAGIAGPLLCVATSALAQQPTSTGSAAAQRPLTLAERQAAWKANEAEYRRRLVNDGQRSADRWLDQQARAKSGSEPSATARRNARGKPNCKKVRWVNRATPGFGGTGMTMSRVPICAD